MKDIAPNVYIEQNSLGLYTGIIQSDDEMVLIDSPLKQLEGGSWKSSFDHGEGCKKCYMIVLDTNYDRLLSIKGGDCVIVAQSDAISPIRSQALKISEDYQQHVENPVSVVGGSRMLPPELIFDTELSLHIGNLQIDLAHHPGSNQSGIWVTIPEREVVFVGDAVVVDQPPFLAYANLEAWEKDLELLSSAKFKDYLIVSSRSGVVDRDQVKTMSEHIAAIRKTLDALMESNAPIEDWYNKIPLILSRFSQMDLFNSEIFYNRLYWGITTYYDFISREKG